MIGARLRELIKKRRLISIVIVISIFLIGGLRMMYYIKSPDVLLLLDRSGAQWIKYDYEFELEIKNASQTQCEFKYSFNTEKNIDNAIITLQALKSAQVFFDGKDIFSSGHDFNKWKKVHDIKIPFTIESGPHEVSIIVTSENSYPAVIAYSETLPLKTDSGWVVSIDGKNWETAVLASQIKQPVISRTFPSSLDSVKAILPYLVIVFSIVMLLSFAGDCNTKNKVLEFFNLRPEPHHIRWMMLFLWTLLAINNLFKLNYQVGTDGWGHIEYIDYIAMKNKLPLASEGWQMYQAPLNYIISAPFYALLVRWFDFHSIVKVLTILPVIYGLLQIEIVYRTAKIVFVERKDLQVIAVITGSLLPIHTYACQYFGNEPLAACLISFVILLCIPLIMPDQKKRNYEYFILLGFFWGLALLSKMTALLLAPVLIIVIVFHNSSVKRSLQFSFQPFFIVFGVSILVAGWYYFRNYMALGNPFAGTYEHSKILQWWQDPSYRTFSQYLIFGKSLIYPIYSGVSSFWDNFYSTLWLDGLNSGIVDFIPWNKNFMIAGALLAGLPLLFIIVGILFVMFNKTAYYRNAVLFSIGMIILFIVAIMDIYMIRPIYSIKASYTLGLLPCYAILIAAGAEPFLRNKIIRSFSLALFACWAFAAYVAYFVK